jgi:hypothetical protein
VWVSHKPLGATSLFQLVFEKYYATHEVRYRRRNFSGKGVRILSEVEFVSRVCWEKVWCEFALMRVHAFTFGVL